MRRFSSRLERGRRSTPRTTLKMAALAPMPSASVRITVMVRPLVRVRERAANLRSCRKLRMASRGLGRCSVMMLLILLFPGFYYIRRMGGGEFDIFGDLFFGGSWRIGAFFDFT